MFNDKLRLTEEEYNYLSKQMGKNIDMAMKVGAEAFAYWSLAKKNRVLLSSPSPKIRYKLNISRSTEWRYRKSLLDNGFI